MSLAATYQSNRSYYPYIDYKVAYSETGRTASSVSYSIAVNYTRVTSHYYGFTINLSYNIGGVTGSVQLKNNSDVQSTSCSFNVTVGTDANGGTISASISSSSPNDSTHWQNGFNTGSRTMSKSSIYSPPPNVAWCRMEGNYEKDRSTTIKFGGQAPVTDYKIYCREYHRFNGWGNWWHHGNDSTHSGSYSIGHGNVNGDAFQMGVAQVNGPYESSISETNVIYHQGVNVWNGNWNGFGQLRVWNGSGWAQGYARVWNGSAWVIAQ